MKTIISICIPTYKRPELLTLAVESCFRQKYRPLEILIGDDSRDDRTKAALDRLNVPAGITMRICVHNINLGQARNVNWLFDNAEGERIILLHDDDLLCDGGVDVLASEWGKHENPLCVYGKQLLIDDDGTILESDTIEFNERYRRTRNFVGRQNSTLAAALLQQLPNNGFLLQRKHAALVHYQSEAEVGQAVDAAFGVRLSQAVKGTDFIYVDQYVSCYRLTRNSILRNRHNFRHDLYFDFVSRLTVPMDCLEAKTICLRRVGAEAVLDGALVGRRWRSIVILLSRHYRHSYMSKRTLFRVLCIISPRLGHALRRTLS
jgi:glycosyltransferase involved in cell wall biosynthesis